MLLVPRRETKVAFKSGCRDESIRHTKSGFPPNPSSTFGDRPIHWEFTEGSEDARRQVGPGGAREEFRPGDHRIVKSVSGRFEFSRASQVVDEDVGVYEDVSHDPTRRGWA
jgi:hypothetical protein